MNSERKVQKTLSPLVVDLDGTLIRSDLLHESAWQALSRRPLRFLSSVYIFLATRNKARLKYDLSIGFSLSPETLPYNENVLEVIRAHKAAGGAVILASASTDSQVQAIAKHLATFDHAIGSSEYVNLSGRNKSLVLNEYLGSSDFIYMGNSESDLDVWADCAGAIVVSKSKKLQKKASSTNQNVTVLENALKPKAVAWVKQLRLYQWLKNILIFVPVLAAFAPWDYQSAFELFAAFLSFSFVASSVYVVNDLFDLENDRRHLTKRSRPIADGRILPLHGLVIAVSLAILGLTVGLLIQPLFGVVILIYLCLTFAYSKVLKRIALIDAIVLAVLYTIRVIAGGIVAEVPVSYWLLSFSIFFFLSLSWVKRYAELQASLGEGKVVAPGRAYTIKDLPIIHSFGVASGFLAILIFALYLDNPLVSQNYPSPAVAWMAIPVLVYLLSRIWLLAHRGDVHEDPLTFVMTDRQSLISISLIGVTLLAAHIGVPF